MNELPATPSADSLMEPLCGIWADVLGRPVTPDHDFLALGGDSIQAIRIIHRVEEVLELEVSVRILLEERTVRAVAARLVCDRGGRP